VTLVVGPLIESMRNLVILALSGLLLCSPAHAEVLYVRPDNSLPAAEYRWHDEIIRDAISVKTAIAVAKAVNGSKPIDGRTIGHRMRFNAYNRALDGSIGKLDEERVSAPVRFEGTIPGGIASAAEIEKIFAIGPDNPLAYAGCHLRYVNGDLTCVSSGAPVGAFLPDGKRFDLVLPFHYPFTQILDQAEGGL